MHIDWCSSDTHVLVNPCYSSKEKEQLNQILEISSSLPNHIWISTSGSTSAKWVGLSKQAILESAQSVNAHLQCTQEDVWIHTLPDFHVGGLGVWARAHLTESTVYDLKQDANKWNAALFHQRVTENRCTLAALVPAQLYDIIQLGLKSPFCMRAVVVGGGHLHPNIYFEAIRLGWKVLPSYGLSECASQVATAALDSWKYNENPPLKLLPHFEVENEEDGRLKLKGSSLLSCYAIFKDDRYEFIDPKIGEWFTSEDRVEIVRTPDSSYLQILGRVDHMIKIGGESVDFFQLESLLCEIKIRLQVSCDVTLIDFPDERLGKAIHLVVASEAEHWISPIVHQFNQQVRPFERIRCTHTVSQIPRSPLLKVLKNELFQLIM